MAKKQLGAPPTRDQDVTTKKFVDAGFVPKTLKVNGHPLDQDVVLDADDVGAATAAQGETADTAVQPEDLGTAALEDVGAFATAAQGAKADSAVQPSDISTVATTGSYDDLTGKPTIPAAQVNSDWNASSGKAQILNKPTIPTTPGEVGAATAAQGAKADSAVQPGRKINAGTGLTGGGDLSADRSLAVSFGTTAGTAAQGNDSRITGAVQGTRKVNNKALSADITLTAEDVGARPNTYVPDWNDIPGLIPTAKIPAAAMTIPTAVENLAEMLALDAQQGDVAIRSDNQTSYMLTADGDPSVFEDWLPISTPGGVTSVNGQDGVVELGPEDVGAATAAQGAKADTAVQPGSLATVATSGSYDDLSNKPTIPTTAGEIGAATAAQGAKADSAVQPAALAAYVPTSRKVNNKSLSADVTLTPGDVGAAPTSHTHTTAQISDSTAVGKSVMTAVDGAAARAAIGAGTSSLAIGTTSSTAMAGNKSATDIGGASAAQGAKADTAVQPAALAAYVPTTRKVAGKALSADVTLVKADVGLGSVDNTADATKAVASAAKLTTARKINGVDFDGTAPITITDATKISIVNGKYIVEHGTDPNFPRPVGAKQVEWRGLVTPHNATAYDEHVAPYDYSKLEEALVAAAGEPPAGELYRNAGGTQQTVSLSGFGTTGDRAFVVVYDKGESTPAFTIVSMLGTVAANGGIRLQTSSGGGSESLRVDTKNGTINGSASLSAAGVGRYASIVWVTGAMTSVNLARSDGLAGTPLTITPGDGMEDAPTLYLNGAFTGMDPLYTAAFRRAFTTDNQRQAVMQAALDMTAAIFGEYTP